VVMETEKFHNQSSASWRPSGAISFKSKGLRTDFKSVSLKVREWGALMSEDRQGKMDVSTQEGKWGSCLSSAFLFSLGSQQIG